MSGSVGAFSTATVTERVHVCDLPSMWIVTVCSPSIVMGLSNV